MRAALRVGDRVRVKGPKGAEGYRPGDKGTVTAVPEGGGWYYLVQMDDDIPAAGGVLFTEYEIEPDT